MYVLRTYMFYIVIIFLKYPHVITSIMNFCNNIYNYSVDPSLIT